MSRDLVATGRAGSGESAALPEKRAQRVVRLTDEIRERALQRLLTSDTIAAFAQALNEELSTPGKNRVPLLIEMLDKFFPQPRGAAPTEQAVVAIQINGGLQRGRKEFA